MYIPKYDPHTDIKDDPYTDIWTELGWTRNQMLEDKISVIIECALFGSIFGTFAWYLGLGFAGAAGATFPYFILTGIGIAATITLLRVVDWDKVHENINSC
ncbi:hypothetical protein N9N03_01830 [Chlamydiia bacterium]|nr:hypothetical protein [Chlamydiia bacterium]